MTKQEEKDYREFLDKELPQGAYDMSTEGIHIYTGKGGEIDFRVALAKELERRYNIKVYERTN